MPLSGEDVSQSMALVLDAFRGFRTDLLNAFGNSEHSRKADNSPVTIWDVAVESAVKSKLQAAFPSVGFQGEETGASGDLKTYWLVDPIDGTSSFIRGLPFCTNMAALVENGHAVAAIIYDFVNDVAYTAVKGSGALKDGQPIHVDDSRQPGNYFVYSMTKQKFGLLQEAMQTLGVRLLLPVGAAGHDYTLIAEGKIDGVIVLHSATGLHDNAPGLLLCEEAGASILSYDDKVGVNRHEFIVGAPKLIELIEHSGLL